MSKPGGVALPAEAVLQAAALCTRHIPTLHSTLQKALNDLESQVVQDRLQRQEVLRKYLLLVREQQSTNEEDSEKMEVQTEAVPEVTGVDRNDPILQWANLHQAAESK